MKSSTLNTIGYVGISIGIVAGILVGAFVSVGAGIGCAIAGALFFIEMQYKGTVIEEQKKQSAYLYEIYDIVKFRFGDDASKIYSTVTQRNSVPGFISQGKEKS